MLADPDDLKIQFESQADRRREMADRYPHDERYREPAQLFDKLAATVADISPEVMNAYRDHFPGRDPYDPLEVIEIEGEHLRSVGFRTHPQSAEEFLRGVIADIRMAGEPQPLRLVSNSRD